MQSLNDALDQIRRVERIGPECLGQIARQHAQSGQFLAHAVVQVLTNAALLERGNLYDLTLQLLPVADVAENAGVEMQVIHLADRQINREGRTILPQAFDLATIADDVLHARLLIPGEVLIVVSSVGGGHDHFHVLADHFVGRVSKHPLRSCVDRLNQSFRVDRDDGVGSGVQNGCQMGFAIMQNTGRGLDDLSMMLRHILGGQFAFGDVDKRDDHAIDPIVQRSVGENPPHVPAAIFRADFLFSRDQIAQQLLNLGEQVVVDKPLDDIANRPATVGGNDPEHPRRGWSKKLDPQAAIQKDCGDVGGIEKVGHVVCGRFHLLDFVVKLVVDGAQLLVIRVQLFLGGFQFLIRRLELLVHRHHFFVRALELLVRALQLLDGVLQVVARGLQLSLQLVQQVGLIRLAACT